MMSERRYQKWIGGTVVLLVCWVSGLGQDYAIKPGHFQVPKSPVLAPEEALRSFELVAGFSIELVAAEPLIEDPVAMSFDEHGRIFVAEMRGFTLDIDGTGEFDRVGRISLLEDVDGDGRMDKSTVFLDQLIQPRAVCAVRGGVLVAEHRELWFAKDTDGDGRADLKELVDPDYATAGSVEHRPNGLMLAIDNWVYNSASTKRYTYLDGRWQIGKLAKRGQWGIAQDDYGRLFYNFNWSQLHADMVPPGYLNRHPLFRPTFAINVGLLPDQKVYPVRPNTAVNRGYTPGVLDSDGRLTTFASACSPLIYRGDNFPAPFQGNAFVCGPCANIIKRNVISQTGVAVTATNAYANREFLASTDERFRPVYQANGPDGALYIVDMYRGVIQQWNFMTKYLREESNQRNLFAPVHKGRIYRVVHGRGNEPMILAGKSNPELNALLSHDNGWVRDTAQRLLIERLLPQRENLDVFAPLIETALKAPDHRARLHAIWTLAGADYKHAEQLLPAVRDPHPEVQSAAIRAIETTMNFSVNGRLALHRLLREMAADASQSVQLQASLTLPNILPDRSLDTMAAIIRENAEWAIMREAVLSGIEHYERVFLRRLLEPNFWPEETQGRYLMIESVANLVAGDVQYKDVFKLIDKPEPEWTWRERAILDGILVRASELPKEALSFYNAPGFVARIDSVKNPELAQSLRRLREHIHWTGRPRVKPRAAIRPLTGSEQKDFAKGRGYFANYCAPCHGTDGRGVRPLGPPLVGSEWVTGVEGRLIRIVLHGMEGPVNVAGKTYEPPDILPSMPSMATITSKNITAILTYIRRAWGHQADPIPAKVVQNLRQLNFGRLVPWKPDELMKIKAGEDLTQGYRPIDKK